jgi:transcriptional regulator of aromatic amino acid metabolism
MMAFDRMPSPRLEAETLDALRAVMQRAMHRGDHPRELQDVLTRAATEAREKQIRAEQLLIMLKELWHSLPDLRSVEDSDRQIELLQELISRCIAQYYGT